MHDDQHTGGDSVDGEQLAESIINWIQNEGVGFGIQIIEFIVSLLKQIAAV